MMVGGKKTCFAFQLWECICISGMSVAETGLCEQVEKGHEYVVQRFPGDSDKVLHLGLG